MIQPDLFERSELERLVIADINRQMGPTADAIDRDFVNGMIARKRDPQTSHEAAARVGEFTGLHEARIVLALKDHGPMTVAEIARETGLQEQQTNKRCSDLERKGAIRTTGTTRLGPSGRQQRAWRAA